MLFSGLRKHAIGFPLLPPPFRFLNHSTSNSTVEGNWGTGKGWILSQTVYQYFANGKAAFFKHQEGREDTGMNKKIIKRLKTPKIQEIALCIYKQNQHSVL